MHELSLCQSIVTIVDRARDGRPVRTVRLRIGELRQVVPETLQYCWAVVTDGSPLTGAGLEIERVAVRLRCRACGAETTVADAIVLLCAQCASGDVMVLAGEEFLLTSIDVETEPGPSQLPAVSAASRHRDREP